MNSSPEKNETSQSSEFQENLETLRQTYFFSGLPLQSLKVLAFVCTREKYKEGELLFKQDEDDGQAFYILSGEAALVCKDDEGNEQTIRKYDTGDFLGGMSLLSKMRRLFSLKARTEVSCLIMTREKFDATMQQFPDLMPKFIRAVVESINTWEGRFLNSRKDSCEICGEVVGFSLI